GVVYSIFQLVETQYPVLVLFSRFILGMHGCESYSYTAMSNSSPASKQLNLCCCMSIAAASFTRFSRKARRASGEMLFPVRSKGMNESFMESLSFLLRPFWCQRLRERHICSHTTPPPACTFCPVTQRAASPARNADTSAT